MSSNVSTEAPVVEQAMSFLDHLDELRRRLTYSAIAVALSFTVCFVYSEKIYAFLSKPVHQALKDARQFHLKYNQTPIQQLEELPNNTTFTYVFNKEANLQGITLPAGTTMPARLEKKGQEGSRSVVAADKIVVGKAVIPQGFKLSLDEIGEVNNSGDILVVHTLQSGFNLYIKVAFYAAIAFSVPFLLYQLWCFIAPGLYENEKRGVVPFVTMATFFFIVGAAFA